MLYRHAIISCTHLLSYFALHLALQQVLGIQMSSVLHTFITSLTALNQSRQHHSTNNGSDIYTGNNKFPV